MDQGKDGGGRPVERRARGRKLSHVLVALVFLGLVPAGMFSAGLVIWQFRTQQREVQRNQLETVRAVAQSVDSEVAAASSASSCSRARRRCQMTSRSSVASRATPSTRATTGETSSWSTARASSG